MKTTTKLIQTTLSLLAACTLNAAADQTASAPARPEKTTTGTILAVDPAGRTLNLRTFVLGKKFMLGSDCICTRFDKTQVTPEGLHPGQKVAVTYQDADGVLVADRVAVEPLVYEGTVKSINRDSHLFTVHSRLFDKTFAMASDCNVVLRNDRPGTVADIQPGNHITVTYETPDDQAVARVIAQTSIKYTGTVTAIDLEEKTLKTRSLAGLMKFNVGGSCVIMLHGKPDGKLADLKPEDRLVINYDEINGVNIVSRIAAATGETNSPAVVLTNPGAGY